MIDTRPRRGERNWYGFRTLYVREVTRFLKIFAQTLLEPLVTSLLFLSIFSVAFGDGREIAGIPYIQFLAPGLIMMSILQNGFANTSSSLIMAKLNENIVDTLMPPLSAGELTAGYALSGATRGVFVGLAVAAGMTIFVPMGLHHIGFVIYFAVAGSMLLALAGTLTSIWAKTYDHVATIQNFILLPLTFFSGSFYSIERLPEIFRQISYFNPIFYLIDGFRYGITGHADSDVMLGATFVAAAVIALWSACYAFFATGYRLKA